MSTSLAVPITTPTWRESSILSVLGRALASPPPRLFLLFTPLLAISELVMLLSNMEFNLYVGIRWDVFLRDHCKPLVATLDGLYALTWFTLLSPLAYLFALSRLRTDGTPARPVLVAVTNAICVLLPSSLWVTVAISVTVTTSRCEIRHEPYFDSRPLLILCAVTWTLCLHHAIAVYGATAAACRRRQTAPLGELSPLRQST
ncbi:hypothetical protein PUNSTDRAFT_52458 [Punctularia strigosozonata HHB-11173 SS5]|uniref:uncharacterized protein n=1 Tax=Punctularia strigosozonata (strain HHB-11173) TaxID=741275 RepID=UPI0004417EDB|nr:uncharacterized protein PUNSTDRAFT_52458 [Punctularia strigosozonata HHB-11173 SS5]EIN09051.1 hypothetical protein PUNSTDRAFT_52458 [Punctularia strigosozonata HHB-11173 SS5]